MQMQLFAKAMNLLLAAATVAEIAPLIKILQTDDQPDFYDSFGIPQGTLDVCITGVGLMAATFALTHALHLRRYDFVLQAGIAGSFDPGLPPGSVVVVRSEQVGDLGAEDNGSFLDHFSLGLTRKNARPFTEGKLRNPLEDMPFKTGHLPKVKGLTVHTVSGHQPTIDARLARHPGVAVESMEGAALHFVCLQMRVPFLQLRAISNYVEPRNREAWQLGAAVGALNAQLAAWFSP